MRGAGFGTAFDGRDAVVAGTGAGFLEASVEAPAGRFCVTAAPSSG
jgi:hypothetical protein